MTDTYIVEVTVQNVSDTAMGAAVAMGWIRDEIESFQLNDVDSFSEENGIRYHYYMQLSDAQFEKLDSKDGFHCLGVV